MHMTKQNRYYQQNEEKNTDNPFRSSDLRVMSPARCLCAMSVKCGIV